MSKNGKSSKIGVPTQGVCYGFQYTNNNAN